MKKIFFYVDKPPDFICYEDTHAGTLRCIRDGHQVIKTTALSLLDFSLIDLGYEIWLQVNPCVNGREVFKQIYPGMADAPNGKDLRHTHNLLRLFLGGAFIEFCENGKWKSRF